MMDMRTQNQLHFQRSARNGQILLYQDGGEFDQRSNDLDEEDIDELIIRMADIEKEQMKNDQIRNDKRFA